jgi:hypothetical protein
MLLLRTSVYRGLSFDVLRFPWSVLHVVCTRHLIIFIVLSALAFMFLMCSSQFILVSKVSSKMRCCLICSIFSSFAHMFILGLLIALVFSVNTLNLVSFAHLIILFIVFCIRIVATRWCILVCGVYHPVFYTVTCCKPSRSQVISLRWIDLDEKPLIYCVPGWSERLWWSGFF